MMKSQVFHGTPNEVQQQLSAFLAEKNIKVHGFAQSQSAAQVKDNSDTTCVVTATILYTEYDKQRKHVVGFTRDE
jgi:hypothetical protein